MQELLLLRTDSSLAPEGPTEAEWRSVSGGVTSQVRGGDPDAVKPVREEAGRRIPCATQRRPGC